jgi:hypothetical protein
MIRVIAVAVLVALLPTHPSRLDRPTPAMSWPRLVMFYGGELGDERRVVARQEDVMRLMDALAIPADPALRTGPYVEVALYWYNPLWEPFAADTARFADLPLPIVPWPGPPAPTVTEPARFVQPARLYLGSTTSPPVFDFFSAVANPGPRSIGPAAIEILRQFNLPVSHAADARSGVGG